jgi:hypothetical protein
MKNILYQEIVLPNDEAGGYFDQILTWYEFITYFQASNLRFLSKAYKSQFQAIYLNQIIYSNQKGA